MPAPRRFEAVLFDLDGVLIDSYEVWLHVMNHAARDLGYPAISREVFDEGWGQGTEADRQRFYPRHTIAEIERFYDAHFADHLEHLVIAEGVVEVFETLARRDIASAIVTNTPNPLARDLVRRAAATPALVVGGNDVPNPKPAPDIVVHACDRLGVDACAAVVLGDSRFDREAARGAGVHFLGLGIDGDDRIERLVDLCTWLTAG